MKTQFSPGKAALWRFGRALIAVIIAGLAQNYGNSEWYLLVAPILLGIDKYIRSN